MAMFRGTKVLVLGATGFIGRWVAAKLSEAGAETVVAVRDRARTEEVGLRESAARICEIDLTDLGRVERLVESLRPKVVFNLAGYGVDPTERDERSMKTINDLLVRTVAEVLARAHDHQWPGQTLIQTGSALEYGDVDGDLRETITERPTSLYGRTKLAGTQAALSTRGIKATVARLFTVYGAGEHPGRLLPSLLHAASTATPVPLSMGTQLRDFTYVEDVAAGLVALAANADDSELVNLATGRLTTVRSFAEHAGRLLKIPPQHLQFGALPERTGDLVHRTVATERTIRRVGRIVDTAIDDGIRRTIDLLSQDR